MPPSKPKPSDIAAEAKKQFIPFIKHTYSSQWPPTSYLCYSESMVAAPSKSPGHTCRFAFRQRDPVDAALDWVEPGAQTLIPVIMPANDKRPGGDWEAGVMSPEECLCRRSNLFATLTTPDTDGSSSHYPIPPKAGIYSERVVVFRDGPANNYTPWPQYKALPIISVPPIRRPKLNSTSKKYSFATERDLMLSQIRTCLRIAIWYNYTQICIGTFGLGSGFRNPVEEVALMWRQAFLEDDEFRGFFQDVLFAFDPVEVGREGSSSGGKGEKGKGKIGSGGTSADLTVFEHVFSPKVIHDAFKAGSSPK